MNKPLRNFFLFVFFFAITLFLYRKTIDSRFVFEFVEMFTGYKEGGINWVLGFSKGFSSYIVSKLVFYCCFTLFNVNPLLWYLLCCALHAVNALMFFLFIKKILEHFHYSENLTISFLSALIFVVSPYHTEVVVWGGAFNYLLVTFFILLNLNALVGYIRLGSPGAAAISLLSFFAAVFSHELGLFLLAADFLILWFLLPSYKSIFQSKYSYLWIGFLLFFLSYFINNFLNGDLIGHYGAKTHLNFKLREMVPAIYRYVFKLLLFSSFYRTATQDKIYGFMQHGLGLRLLIAFSAVLIFLMFVLVNRNKRKYGAPVLFCLLFGIFVFPILNLYFPTWILIQADRYCYVPGGFLFASLMSVILRKRNTVGFILALCFLVVSVFLLKHNTESWAEAGKLEIALEKDFKWWNADKVYILNRPDNYNGAYIYRALEPSSFAATAGLRHNKVLISRSIIEILGYNLRSPDDSVIVEVLGPNRLRVTLSEWGTWWWKHGSGAESFEDDYVKVNIDAYSHSYEVEFKKRNADDVFIYQAGDKWREVKDFKSE